MIHTDCQSVWPHMVHMGWIVNINNINIIKPISITCNTHERRKRNTNRVKWHRKEEEEEPRRCGKWRKKERRRTTVAQEIEEKEESQRGRRTTATTTCMKENEEEEWKRPPRGRRSTTWRKKKHCNRIVRTRTVSVFILIEWRAF